MLAGVGITCFAGSYTVALALELTRVFSRSGVRSAVLIAFAAAGLFTHTVYLYYHAVSANALPLSSERDWYLVAAWVLAAFYLYLACYHPRTSFGLYLLPLILALIGAAVGLASTEPFPREPASRAWGIIHGTSILLATVAVSVGFAAGLMYLRQSWRLKRKLPASQGQQLPSLEWLQRANSRAVVVSVILVGLGLLSGVVLNLIHHGPTGRVPWSDPIIVTTLAMFCWLVVSLVFTAVYPPARQGGKVAYLTVASFVFLVAALSVGLLVDTQHGGTNPSSRRQPERAAQRREAAEALSPEREPQREPGEGGTP